jgi:hypothetical protein
VRSQEACGRLASADSKGGPWLHRHRNDGAASLALLPVARPAPIGAVQPAPMRYSELAAGLLGAVTALPTHEFG